jgi:hypothetical protein
MSPVAPEQFLMLVEKSVDQSPNDPLTILLPNPEDPEGFQPLLLCDRPSLRPPQHEFRDTIEPIFF